MTASRALTLALCASLASCTTLPRRGVLAMRDVAFPLKDRTLPSGLRVVVEEDHTEPLVAVVTLIGAGGANDPKGKEGLAHFVEHLTFRSRPDAKGPNVWNLLEQAGVGTINAFTSLDYTLYYAVGPKEILPELLRLHGLLVTAPVISVAPEIFNVEREVVRSELRERNETGYVSQAFSWTQEAVFPEGHPYHRPVVGTHESLTAIKPEDVSSFARAHYTPDNATMVIIGDVDLQAMDAALEASLPGRLFKGAGILPSRLSGPAQEPPLREPQPFTVRHGSVVVPELYIGWSLPRSFDADSHLMRYAVRSANENLGRASFVDPDILGAWMQLIPGKHASLVMARVSLARGAHPQRSAEAVLDQLYKAWGSSEGIGNSSAQAQTESISHAHRRLGSVVSMLEEGQDLTSRAMFRAETTHFFRDPGAYSRALGTVARVEPSKVQEFSFKYLNRERARVVYVAPHAPGTEPPVGATGLGTEASDSVAVTADGAPSALRSRPPPVRFAKASSRTLENGIEVVVLPRTGLPLVTVTVLLHGGTAQSTPKGAAELGDRLGFAGSRLHGSPGEIGASSASWYDTDELRYEFRGSSGNLANLLAMASERIPSMKIDEWVLREVKREWFPSWKVLDDRPDVVAARRHQAALFGEHPYGQVSTTEDWDKVGYLEVLGWFGRTHVPKNAVVVIAGEVDEKIAFPLAQQWLGQWGGNGEEIAPPAPPTFASRAEQILITHKPASTQTRLTLGCVLPSPDEATRVRHQLLNAVLRAELNERVRERLGASYGIWGSTQAYRGGVSRLELGGAIDRTRTGQVLSLIKASLRDHAEKGFEGAAIERARWRLLRSHEVSFLSNRDAASAIARARNLGATVGELDAFPQNLLRAAKSEVLQKDLKTCLDAGLVISAVGDEPSIQAALAEADASAAKVSTQRP